MPGFFLPSARPPISSCSSASMRKGFKKDNYFLFFPFLLFPLLFFFFLLLLLLLFFLLRLGRLFLFFFFSFLFFFLRSLFVFFFLWLFAGGLLRGQFIQLGLSPFPVLFFLRVNTGQPEIGLAQQGLYLPQDWIFLDPFGFDSFPAEEGQAGGIFVLGVFFLVFNVDFCSKVHGFPPSIPQ